MAAIMISSKPLKKTILLISLLFYSLLCPAQEFIDMEYLLSYDRATIIENFGIPATNGVDLYKVRYTSIDLEGSQDTLSGLIAIPDEDDFKYPLLIYAHGTSGSREDVPSRLTTEHLIPVVFGSLGYFSISPDYLGLGDSDGVHPYVHADSEASACYDMIKAIRTSGEDNAFLINDQNFIFGYSQGGHAAMALHRYMETEAQDGYEVTASAPSSGPYSLSGEMKNFILGDVDYFFVAYLANVALSYQAVYGNILGEEGLYSLFKPEYATEIEKYANEEIDLFELNDTLLDLLIQNHGKTVSKFMLLEDKLDELANDPESPINVALLKNDVYDWAPQAPTRLFYCMADDQVVYTNSLVAEAAMVANGASDVASLDVGSSLSHTECVPNAVTLAYFFFSDYQDKTQSIYPVQANNQMVFYPNPSHGYFTIKDKEGEYRQGLISIMDLQGNLLSKFTAGTGEMISASGLIPGQYIVIWSSGQDHEVHRMIIVE